MAAKTTKKKERSPDDKAIGRVPDQPAGGIAAEDLEVLNQPIDDRMAALLKDHQEMGSRPK